MSASQTGSSAVGELKTIAKADVNGLHGTISSSEDTSVGGVPGLATFFTLKLSGQPVKAIMLAAVAAPQKLCSATFNFPANTSASDAESVLKTAFTTLKIVGFGRQQ